MGEDCQGYVTVVAGSRSITDESVVRDAIEAAPFCISRVVSGGADGVDTIAEKWARENDVPVETYLPDRYQDEANSEGIPAPLVRNRKMAETSEACILVWDGESRGTMQMKRMAEEEGLEIEFHRTDVENLDSYI